MPKQTHILLTGRIPSKKNSKQILCRGKYPKLISSEAHAEWHKVATEQIKKQAIVPLQCRFDIKVEFYMPDDRKADLSNKFESIADLLVDTKIITGDHWQIMGEITLIPKGIDRKNPRAEIVLEHLEQ